jgi:STE24 endopeptidase
MFTALFYIILLIITADFLLERYLERLNIRHSAKELPVLLKGIFDEEKYKQQQAYLKVNYRFGLWSSGFNFLILTLMLFLSGFSFVNNLAASISTNPVWWALIFLGTIMLAAGLLNLPFSIVDTFVIEQKFGFNKTTPKTFMLDLIKSLILGAVIGGGLMALIIWIYGKTGSLFWLLAWGLVTLFSIFMVMFYSNLIVPLFNKQTPLPEGELRTAIREFARKVGFKLDNIFIINGSKRSSKGNAYFTGLGPRKRIVLYDTLIDELTVNELVAVLAHEIGHYRKKHVLVSLIIGVIQAGVLLFLFSLFVGSPALSRALGVEQPNFHIGMIAFGILYSPVSMVTGLLGNLLSRRYEYQADGFACENSDPAALTAALKKLSAQNLSNLTPHPLYVFFHYSHPPLYERLKNIQRFILHES